MTETTSIEVGPDLALTVDVDGNAGPPVAVLHGFTGDASTMRGLADRLAEDFRVVTPDLVGHGRSPSPDIDGIHSVDAMVAHVVAMMAARGVARFHLVGYSMGGRVALTAACTHPDRVASVTTIGASAGLASATERAARQSSDEALALAIEVDGLAAFVDRWMANPLFATQARLGPDVLAASRIQRLGNTVEGLTRSLRQAGTGVMRPLHDALARCPVPAVFVAGADDEKFTAIASELAASMPTAAAEIVAHAGHAVHLEQPDVVAEIVRTTVRRVP